MGLAHLIVCQPTQVMISGSTIDQKYQELKVIKYLYTDDSPDAAIYYVFWLTKLLQIWLCTVSSIVAPSLIYIHPDSEI